MPIKLLILSIPFISLRKNAGGLNAKTKVRYFFAMVIGITYSYKKYLMQMDTNKAWRKINETGKMGFISLALVMMMCMGAGTSAMAAEKDASLSSLSITDLTVDERNEIYVEVKVMGTAKSVPCRSNGMQCTENYN